MWSNRSAPRHWINHTTPPPMTMTFCHHFALLLSLLDWTVRKPMNDREQKTSIYEWYLQGDVVSAGLLYSGTHQWVAWHSTCPAAIVWVEDSHCQIDARSQLYLQLWQCHLLDTQFNDQETCKHVSIVTWGGSLTRDPACYFLIFVAFYCWLSR